jgi:hypothetical protein
VDIPKDARIPSTIGYTNKKLNKAVKIIFGLSVVLFLTTCIGVLKTNGFLY